MAGILETLTLTRIDGWDPRPSKLPLRTAYSPPLSEFVTTKYGPPHPPSPFSTYFMERLPLDHFSSDPPLATSFSSSQSPMPPPAQTSFRSDEPDPFKISFLKGPKRKRLAKVRISVKIFLLTSQIIFLRLAMPVTRASDDAMALVSLHSSPFFPASRADPVSKRHVVIGMYFASRFPPLACSFVSNSSLCSATSLPRSALTQTLLADPCRRPWHQKPTNQRGLALPAAVLRRIFIRNLLFLPPQAFRQQHAESL